MRHTLKAVLDHRSDARRVTDALLAEGDSRADMALSSRPPMGQVYTRAQNHIHERVDSLCTAVKHRFTRLFGSLHHQNMVEYFMGLMHNNHVVTLTTKSEPEAMGTVDIIERFYWLGRDECQGKSDDGGAGAGMPGLEALVAESGTQQRQSMSYHAVAPGALQNRAHEHNRYFGTQDAESSPTGNTFQETMGAATQWHSYDTQDALADIRSGNEDKDRAAYRYGNEMRTSDQYRDCSWDEAEPGLKNGWEALAIDASTWQGSVRAIRRGWNGTSPDIDDDRYYRAHWNAIYRNSAGKPDYDDRTPAFLYGSEARLSGKYGSCEWRDVEERLEADWTARHGGQRSSWENFKDAVRHGWNRIGEG